MLRTAMKSLLAADANPLAGVNVVQVPPDGVIGRHRHVKEIETVYVLCSFLPLIGLLAVFLPNLHTQRAALAPA